MTTNKKLTVAGLVILTLVLAVTAYSNTRPAAEYSSPAATPAHDSNPVASDAALSYFIDTVTAKAKAAEDYEEQGMEGGVDGAMLLKAYPGLQIMDFDGVRTLHGEYSVANGELVYTGNAPSNATLLTREGMQAVLNNVSKRLSMPVSTKAEVNLLLERIGN